MAEESAEIPVFAFENGKRCRFFFEFSFGGYYLHVHEDFEEGILWY